MFKKNPFIFGLFFLMFILSMGLIFAYDINITFYDESTLEPIPTVTITDANGSTYTSDVNGLWTADLIGANSFEISKTGYDSRKLQFYFNADANYNFLLNPSGNDSSIGFIVKDSNNNLWTNKYLMFARNRKTYFQSATNSFSDTSSQSSYQGYRIYANHNISIISVNKFSACNATKVYLYTDAGVLISSATFNGNTATFNTAQPLIAGTYYRIEAGSDGSNYNMYYNNSATFPYNNEYINFIGSSINGANTNYPRNLTGILTTKISNTNPIIINSLLTSSQGYATGSIDPAGDYNANLYTADSNLSDIYTKTIFTVNKPQQEISPGNEISPYDITVGGLLNYTLTNHTSSSVDVGIFAGTIDNYTFSVVDYNANPVDRQYLERSYVIKVPMGTGYESAITYQPYLVGVTDVIVPRIYVLDQLTRTIQDAEVYISTSINFVDTVVESGLTDSGGVFQFSAIPLKNYYVSIYYLGEFRGSFLIKPRTSDDVFYVTIDRSTTEDTSNTFIIDIDLSETKENVSTDENVSVIGTITANYNYINSYTIQAYQGSSLKYEDTILATGTSIDINKTIDFNLFEPYYDIRIVVTANYSIGGVSGTQSANKRIMISNQIDKISLFRTARQELGQPLAIILALIITAIILAIITLSGLPIAPAVTGLFGITILGVFMFLGWLDIGVVILGIDIGKLMYILLVGISIYMLTRIGSV